MPGETPAQDPLSQVVPGKEDMGDDYDAIVVQMTQLMEHSDPAQKPPWDGSGLPETVAEMQALDAEDLKRKVTALKQLRDWVRKLLTVLTWPTPTASSTTRGRRVRA